MIGRRPQTKFCDNACRMHANRYGESRPRVRLDLSHGEAMGRINTLSEERRKFWVEATPGGLRGTAKLDSEEKLAERRAKIEEIDDALNGTPRKQGLWERVRETRPRSGHGSRYDRKTPVREPGKVGLLI